MTNANDTPRVTLGPWRVPTRGVVRSAYGRRVAELPQRDHGDAQFIADCANAIFAIAKHTGRDPAALARWAAEGGLVRMYDTIPSRKFDEGCCCVRCQIAKLPAEKEADHG